MAKVEGVEEIIRKLRELDAKIQKKHLRTSLRAGAKIIQKQMQADAPEKTGQLRKEIKVRAGRSGKGFVSVAVAVGSKLVKGKAWYAAFVDLGHFLGKRLRGKFTTEQYHRLSLGVGRKFVPGTHFAERAFASAKGAATQAATDKLAELIDQES